MSILPMDVRLVIEAGIQPLGAAGRPDFNIIIYRRDNHEILLRIQTEQGGRRSTSAGRDGGNGKVD
jgi:hypothetical protein